MASMTLHVGFAALVVPPASQLRCSVTSLPYSITLQGARHLSKEGGLQKAVLQCTVATG